jgi:glyoxylase-like metal-dependent hydrolase (beta-lactamase superfamily II)
MRKMLLIGVSAGAVLSIGLGVQAQDARAVVDAAAKAMGTTALQGVEYGATSGATFAVGQAAGPGKPWPRFTVTKYSAAINYTAPAMREQTVRIDDANPPRGGGAGPYVPETQQGGIRPIPFGPQTANALRDGRTENGMVQIWMTPHGFLKGAAAGNATMAVGGARGRAVSFTAFGKYTITGTINDQNLVERVETKLPNTLYGDMAFEAVFSDYKDYAGVKFPTRIVQRQGGFPTLELTIDSVQPNSPAALAVTLPARPAGAPAGPAPAARVEGKEMAPGFWALTGAVPISFLVEFSDHVVIIEAPGSDERTEAVLAEVKRLVPGKPVRYVVNTHGHSDHSGGLRSMVAAGIPIITHQANKAYYEKILKNPATIAPDNLARNPRAPVIEGMGEKRVLTDGTQTIELHHVKGNLHEETLLMVYLPKSKLLIQADAFAPRSPGAKPLPHSPYTTNLFENVQRLKLDVAQMVHVHGGMDPIAKLVEAANRRGTN